jgi:hypothetical protein
MNHQRIPGVERANDVLAAAANRCDRRPGQTVDQRLRRGAAHGSIPTDLDTVDATTDDERDHPAPNRLDLRKFWHG